MQNCIYLCLKLVIVNNKTGSPVIGSDFFGREKEIEYVWDSIKNGNNIMLPSPRRVGKTSFALKMIEKAKKEGWKTVSINLEEHNELEFINDFANQLIKQSTIEKIKQGGAKLLEEIKQLKPKFAYEGVEISLEWQIRKKDLYQKLKDLLDHEKPTLIFLDELTVLLSKLVKQENGVEKASDLLHWMRAIRTKASSKIKWIYCSSVGIENFTHTYNISESLNDVTDYYLKSFDENTSKKMLHKLGAAQNAVELNEVIIENIIDKLDYCIPFFLQIMYEKISYLIKVEGKPNDETIVTEAYKRITEEKHFNTWIERIEKQYGDLANHSFTLLKHICQEKSGSKRQNIENQLINKIDDPEKMESILSRLLYMLKNDGYLIEEDSLYKFRSPLLRDFWFKRFVL